LAEYILYDTYFQEIKDSRNPGSEKVVGLERFNTEADPGINSGFKTAADAYDSAYSELDQFIFPFLGETPEEAAPWIKLVELFFDRKNGGFWLVDTKDRPILLDIGQANLIKWQDAKKPYSVRKVDDTNLSGYFKLVNDTFRQGGSSVISKDQFNELGTDMLKLIAAYPGIKPRLKTLLSTSFAKWNIAHTKETEVTDEILRSDFNSMYSQLIGELMELYKKEKEPNGIYEKNGATIAKVSKLIGPNGTIEKIVRKILDRGTVDKTGLDNSAIYTRFKAKYFNIPIFIKYFFEKFSFESPGVEDSLKPSSLLTSIAGGGSASTGEPATSKDLLSKQAQAPVSSTAKAEVKTNQPTVPGAAPVEKAQETADETGTKSAETPTKTQEEAAQSTTNSNSTQLETVTNTANNLISSITNSLSNITTGSIIQQTYSLSPDAITAKFYADLKVPGMKNSYKLRKLFLTLDQGKQQEFAQQYVKNPGNLPQIISTILAETTNTTSASNVTQKDFQKEINSLMVDRKSVSDSKTKETQTTLGKSAASTLLGAADQKSESENPAEDVASTTEESKRMDLSRLESNKQIRPYQASQVLNPPNPVVESLKGVSQTIQNTSQETSTQINKAITSTVNRPAESSVSNTSNVSNNTTNISKTEQSQKSEDSKKDKEEEPKSETSLSDFYLHAIYDVLVSQGIKIKSI
jgi:hypothetical protein